MSDHGRIDDGYGEQLSPEQVLALYEQRAQVIAWEWSGPLAPKEDLAQEARIALWQEARKRTGEQIGSGLATVVIRRAIGNAALHQRWTGTEYTRGKHKDPIRTQPLGIDQAARDAQDHKVSPLWLVAADLLEDVEYAYHEGQIMQAINALPAAHREYVYLKFWQGMTESEIAAHVGRTKGNVNRTWHETIRPKLRASLANLVGAW